MALSLDIQAQALLQVVQAQKGTIAAAVEQQIETAQTQSGKPKLDAEQLAQVLLQAMPAEQGLIQSAKAAALKYHPDGTNSGFLTQLLDFRIEKEEHVGTQPNDNRGRPVRTDPMYTQFSMAPDAQFILLFNARDVDENGRPLLMKVVAREGADLTKLDLTRYRTQPQHQPDIVKVKDDADFIDVQDTNESEFAFGDPLKAVSLDKSAAELSALVKVKPANTMRSFAHPGMWLNGNSSTNVIVPNMSVPGTLTLTNGDQLDRTGVAVFDKRVQLDIGIDVDAWQSPTLLAANVKAKLNVGRGLIFEPGARANVSVLGASFRTSVPANDALLLGSAGGATDVPLTQPMTLNQLLDSPLTIASSAVGNDASTRTKTVREIVYADTPKATFGGRAVSPAGTRTVARSDFAAAGLKITKDVLKDEQRDGQKVSIELPAGLLSNNGVSVQGWKLAVGYMDPATNTWVELSAQTIDNDKASKPISASFDVPDSVAFNRANAQIEVRAFTNTGFPAERLQIGYREVPWGTPPAIGAQGSTGQGGQG